MMTEMSETIVSNSTIQYAFRFSSSDEVIHLTQKQIDLIPYLSALIVHKDDFVSIANQNGEYVLNPPIEYHSLTAILRSISSNNPYKLFDQLPEDENVFNTLQLFDYLGLQPFPSPLLKEANSIRSKSIQKEGRNKRIRYHQANVSEVRRTAAEFIIALMKNEYKLHDSNTMETIFNLVDVILYNAGVFNLRFRDHTLIIAKKSCYQFLTKTQRRQLETSHRLPQYMKIYSEKFQNTFNWRGSYVTIEKKITQVPSTTLQNPSNTYTFPRFESYRSFSWNINFSALRQEIFRLYSLPPLTKQFSCIRISSIDSKYGRTIEKMHNDRKVLIEKLKRELQRRKPRSDYFDRVPKRPYVDKFKHRCGPKAQKYR